MSIHLKPIYRNLIATLAFISLLLILNQLHAIAAQDDWFMLGHDRQHTGCSPFTGPDTPNVKWTFELDGGIAGSPVMASDGTIYIGSDHSIFYAINPDGSKKWEFTVSGGICSSAAVGLDGTVYVGTTDGHFYAINPDGTKKWEYVTGSIESSPAVGTDGTIYIGTFDKKLYAFNLDGSKKWDFTTGNSINSSPAISLDGTIYVGSQDHKLYALNPDGTKKWEFLTKGSISSSPAIDADGTVFVGSDDKKLYAIKSDGSKKWTFATGGPVRSSPAIATDGTALVGSDDHRFYAVNKDGSLQWSYKTGVHQSIAIGADGTIYVTGDSLYAITPSGFWKWNTNMGLDTANYSSPVIASDGTIYASNSNMFCAIGTSHESTLTVSSITPNFSINSGSIKITKLSGTGFMSGATVKLSKTGPSDIIATDVKVIDSSNITCVFDLYDKPAGYWNIVVTNPDSEYGILENGFNMQNPIPKVAYTIPDRAPSGSYVSITELAGEGFLPGAIVKLARGEDKDIIADNVTVENSSKITCRIDLSNAGVGNWAVEVLNPGMQSSIYSSDFYVYSPVPQINRIIVNNAMNTGPVSITDLSGEHFSSDATVKLSKPGQLDITAYDITVVDSSKITCVFNLYNKVPGHWNVVVTNSDGYSGTLTDGFTINSTKDVSDWWMFNHDVQHTGRSQFIGPDQSNVKWEFEAGGGTNSSAAIDSDGTIYVGWENNYLYAINPDGSKKWEFETGDSVNSSPAISSSGTIYVGSCDNKLYAINRNGSQKWAFETNGAVLSSPAIIPDGTIYVGSMDGSVYAINSDGSKKWEFVTDGEVESSPALGFDGTVYVGSNNGSMYAINTDGSKKWEFKTVTGQIGSPAKVDPFVNTIKC